MQKFYKYQGTGNDFVMIDDRRQKFPMEQEIIAKICDRRFGIGADGLILLQEADDVYQMLYFNADGNQSTMCGNGGRCFVRFLSDLGFIKTKVTFNAIDGLHHGEVLDPYIKLQMSDVEKIKIEEDYVFLDTGSPHHIVYKDLIDDVKVDKEGAKIRYSEQYPEGTNVNFVQQLSPNRIAVRTYERGVEAETLSCGTGVTAAAISLMALGKTQVSEINVKTLGGSLRVYFNQRGETFTDVALVGPAEFVFKGKIKI